MIGPQPYSPRTAERTVVVCWKAAQRLFWGWFMISACSFPVFVVKTTPKVKTTKRYAACIQPMHYRPKRFCDTKSPMMPCIGIWFSRWETSTNLMVFCQEAGRMIVICSFGKNPPHRLKEGLDTPKTQGVNLPTRQGYECTQRAGRARELLRGERDMKDPLIGT